MNGFLKSFGARLGVFAVLIFIVGSYMFVDNLLYNNAETIQGSYSSEFCENNDNNGKKVAIEGYIIAPDSFRTDGDDLKMILLEDGGEGEMDVVITVDNKDPNTMDMLPDMYYDRDIKLRDRDGNVVDIFEDKVKLVGKYRTSDCSLEKVTDIEVVQAESVVEETEEVES